MGLLYVNENGAQIGYEANKCVVNYKDGLKNCLLYTSDAADEL